MATPNARPDNEHRICEAVIGFLEREAGCLRSEVTYPERDGSGPPVEVRFRLGPVNTYAIEHTEVEPFPNAIRTGIHFGAFVDSIESELKGNLPGDGTYKLIFPIDPMTGRHRRVHNVIRNEIVSWVRTSAPEMAAETESGTDREQWPFGRKSERRTVIQGIALSLSLNVHWGVSKSCRENFYVLRSAPDGIEGLRLERLREALERKIPKLTNCKRLGDITLLVLENSDISLSNRILVAVALKEALKAWIDKTPDQIFIVNTCVPGQMTALRPVVGQKFDLDASYFEL